MSIDDAPDDLLEGPGFTMIRRGRRVELKTHRSAKEQRELLSRMQESRPEILAEIQRKTAEFLDILHKYSSLDLLANLFLRDSMHDPNEYVESESKLRPHYVEHAAVLELKDPKYELRPTVLVDSRDVENARSLLDEIFERSVLYYIAENANPDATGPPSRMDELRFITLLHGMAVRSPAYAAHWRDVLLGLFSTGSAAEWLSQAKGIDVRGALAIIDAIESHIVGTFTGRVQQARKTYDELIEQLKQYKATGVFAGEASGKELLDRLRNMRKKEAKRYLRFAMSEWTRVALGMVLSFSVDRIVELSGVTENQTEAFLEQVSIGFASTPADYVLPAPVNVLHTKPVIRYNAAYFCAVPHLLPWCIKPTLEGLLSAGPAWNSYQKQRSSFLVSTALSYLVHMLPGASAYENLYYPDEAGNETELDGLVLFDRYALLLEGKAGSLGAARRAGPLKMKTQLESLVGEAADQVVRAHGYVRKSQAPSFRLQGGGTVSLDKSKYTEHVLMTVTLDVLDIFTADMYQMLEIGVVTTHDLPWSVALTDLRAISDIIARPFEFTHFMRWRLSRLDDASVSGGRDELNWLGVYLKDGPRLPTVPPDQDFLTFTSYTDDFDAYFLYKEGARTTPAPRPAQPLPPPMDRLCDALVASGQQGFTEAGECLLDLRFNEREQFARKLVEYAFNQSKGRSSQFEFIAESCAVKVVAGDMHSNILEIEAATLMRQCGRRAIVFSVTASPEWSVHNWAVSRQS